MQRVNFCALFTLAANPAIAEVCDKVRPDWNPSSGPVSQAQELFHFLASPSGIFFILLCLIAVFVRSKWVFVLTVIVLATSAGLYALNWFWPTDGVTYGAYLEGCTGHPLVPSIAIFALALTAGIFARTRKH